MSIILMGCLLSLPDATEPDAASEVQRLTDLWRVWREETKSLKVSGWRFIGVGAQTGDSVSRDEFLPVMSTQLVPLVRAKHNDIVRSELEAITEPLFSGDVEARTAKGRAFARWQRFEFVQGSAGRRLDFRTKDNDEQHAVRKDGKEQRYRSRIKQASLYPSETNLHMESLDDFIYMPPIKVLRHFEVGPAGRYSLRNRGPDGAFSIEYDAATGFIFHDTRQLATGLHMLERIQELPMTVGVVSVPRFVSRIQYRADGAIRRVFLYIIDAVEINAPVSDADFQIAVPKNTAIVDFGKQVASKASETGKAFVARRTAQPVHDVLEESTKPEFVQGATSPHSDSKQTDTRLLKWLVIVNAVPIILFVAWWFHVRFRRS